MCWFASILVFVSCGCLEGPTLDPLAPAQSKRIFVFSSSSSTNRYFSCNVRNIFGTFLVQHDQIWFKATLKTRTPKVRISFFLAPVWQPVGHFMGPWWFAFSTVAALGTPEEPLHLFPSSHLYPTAQAPGSSDPNSESNYFAFPAAPRQPRTTICVLLQFPEGLPGKQF